MDKVCPLCNRTISAASDEIIWGDLGEFHRVCFEMTTAQATSREQAIKMIQDKIYEETTKAHRRGNC